MPNNFYRCSGLKEVERNCPLLKCDLCRETPLQRGQFGKEGKETHFTGGQPENQGQAYHQQWQVLLTASPLTGPDKSASLLWSSQNP